MIPRIHQTATHAVGITHCPFCAAQMSVVTLPDGSWHAEHPVLAEDAATDCIVTVWNARIEPDDLGAWNMRAAK